MNKLVIFGGATEGRELASFLEGMRLPALVSVATEYGEAVLPKMKWVQVRAGRLKTEEMVFLLNKEQPIMVIDATHPYATEVSRSIEIACNKCGLPCIQVIRENALSPEDLFFGSEKSGSAVSFKGPENSKNFPFQQLKCLSFDGMDSLISWLNGSSGIIFSTLGAKEAEALSQVNDFSQRIWLRILPLPESLEAARRAGFPSSRLICMQGPFSTALNEAMFRETGAAILLTKDSGKAGGFWEKLAAAEICHMTVAILSRPSIDGLPGEAKIPEDSAKIQEMSLDKLKTFIEKMIEKGVF